MPCARVAHTENQIDASWVSPPKWWTKEEICRSLTECTQCTRLVHLPEWHCSPLSLGPFGFFWAPQTAGSAYVSPDKPSQCHSNNWPILFSTHIHRDSNQTWSRQANWKWKKQKVEPAKVSGCTRRHFDTTELIKNSISFSIFASDDATK